MKKIIVSVVFVLFGFIVFESFSPSKLMKKDGAAPGYTGSPGDSMKNCTACHGGTAYYVSDWITSNIPAEGYVPGQTYKITAANKEVLATRFGFEVSPQNVNGDLIGMMIITDTIKTKLVGADKYITYTENGVTSKDSMAWTFNWMAPKAGTGFVTFYGGFNSNFDGHKDGDHTYLSTMGVKEFSTISISTLSETISHFITYPNPSNDKINIISNLQTGFQFLIIDLSGIVIMKGNSSSSSIELSTEDFPNGVYIALISEKDQVINHKKFVVNH